MRADFYLIDKPRFREQPLLLVCELARRAHAAGQPTLILARDFAQAEAVDDLLWSFDDDAFIPHQLAGDDDDGETAVLIVPPGIETADRPLVINLRDTCAPGRFSTGFSSPPSRSLLNKSASPDRLEAITTLRASADHAAPTVRPSKVTRVRTPRARSSRYRSLRPRSSSGISDAERPSRVSDTSR